MAVREQVSCDVGGEAVILSLANGTYFGLDPVGARIWQLVQEPRTVSEVRDALLAEYEVDAERCEASIVRLLGELEELGLVIEQSADPGSVLDTEGRQVQG